MRYFTRLLNKIRLIISNYSLVKTFNFLLNSLQLIIKPYNNNIVISYSEFHFTPNKTTLFIATSAGQIAYNIYNTISKIAPTIYKDNIGFYKTRLWFVQGFRFLNNHGKIKANKIIFFFPGAHLNFSTKELNKAINYYKVENLQSSFHCNQYTIKTFNNFIKKKVDKLIIVGNDTIRNTYIDEGIDQSKITCLNYGIDTSIFYLKKRRSEKKITFIFSSSFELLKGYYHLINAWKNVENKYDNIELYLLGGNLKSNIINCKSFGKYIAGSPKHVNILNSAHYIIAPTLSEGQQGALLEGIACGCVPIATRESGIDADKYGGYVFDSNNTSALIDILEKVIHEHRWEEWKKKSNIAISSIIERHNWSNFNSQIYKIVESVYNED